ncbi:MAG TPA: T9SS type B sorting domain-containing protein, partial [Bacteroidetes bacterium]|nr:T9SS type B sorting domain-containing protein [Bacteroidota bacterium]
TFHGDLPPMMNAAGDLTFRNDSLFLAAYFKNIVLVDIDNPLNSQIHFSYPDSLPDIFGVCTFYFDCDSLVSFGSGSDGLFYLIDFGTNEIIPTGCSSMTTVNGLATPDEWQASGCDLSMDLDGDDSSALNGPMPEDGYYQVVCDSALLRIVDLDLVIDSDYFIDSVVWNILPHANSGADFFSWDNLAFHSTLFNIEWDMDGAVFSNLGMATAADFENLLNDTWYVNMPYTPGLVEMQLIAWANNGTVSDTAVSLINFLPGPVTFSLGADTTLCPDQSLQLSMPPGLQYQIDSFSFGITTWQDGSHNSTFIVNTPGLYFSNFTFDQGIGCTWADTITVGQADTSLTTAIQMACAGETVFINGQPFVSDTTVCTQYTSLYGCDSTHCTQLVFLPPASSSFDTTVCQGQSVLFGGQHYGAAGVYRDTLSTWYGCDSIVQMTLAVLPSDTTQLAAAICQGDAYVLGGQMFSVAGVYYVPLPAANGCDSTVALNLSVSLTDTTILNVTLCQGEVYEAGGMLFSDEGLYEIMLTDQNNCDSLLMLNLSVQPMVEIHSDTSICEGQTILFDGTQIGLPGLYTDTLYGSGCDTALLLELAVLPPPEVSVQVETDTCEGTAVLSALSAAPFFLWSNGSSESMVGVAQSGTYTVTVTNMAGCTSEAFAQVDLLPLLAAEVHISPPACYGEQNGFIEITETTGGTPPYLFSINGGAFSPVATFETLPAGNYALAVTDANGCLWESHATLEDPPPFVLNAGPNLTIAPGQNALIEASASAPVDSLWWLPPDFLECPFCLVTTAMPPADILYQAFALDTNGCLATDQVAISVARQEVVFAPNAFSPNSDGINDFFTLYAAEGENILIRRFSIFDRWGNQVFHAENLVPGTHGWDGNHRGQPAAAGVYAWLAKVEPEQGGNLILKGGIHLVR